MATVLRFFYFPSFGLLENVFRYAFAVFAILTSTSVVLAAFCIVRAIRSRRSDYLILLLITVFAYLHQFNLVAVCFFIYLFTYSEGLLALRHPQVKGLALAIAVAFVFWLGCGLLLGEPNEHVISGKSTQLRQTIKALSDYPKFAVWVVLRRTPIISLIAALGFLWCFHGASKKLQPTNKLLAILLLLVPLLTLGLFETRPNFRYFSHLNPLYLILFAVGLLRWHEVVAIFSSGKGRRKRLLNAVIHNHRVRTVISGFALVAVLVNDVNPLASWLSTERTYYEIGSVYKKYGLDYYPDYRTTGMYVKSRLKDGDVVIVMDWLQQYHYIGRIDYWIRTDQFERTYSRNGSLRDLYTGVLIIPTLQKLKKVIRESRNRRIWIVTSSLEVRKLSKVSADVVEFLAGLSPSIVYVGKDRESKVYLLRTLPSLGRSGSVLSNAGFPHAIGRH